MALEKNPPHSGFASFFQQVPKNQESLARDVVCRMLTSRDLAGVARVNRFFKDISTATSSESWRALVVDNFSAEPVLLTVGDAKSHATRGKYRLETYKEMYQRLELLRMILRKELMAVQKKSDPIERAEWKYHIFSVLVEHGFDKFDQYFPQLWRVDVNLQAPMSALHRAAQSGQIAFMRKIIAHGGNVHAPIAPRQNLPDRLFYNDTGARPHYILLPVRDLSTVFNCYTAMKQVQM